MTFIPIFFIAVPIAYFCIQSYRERDRAGSLVRFFQYGDSLKNSAFFATFITSNSGLSPAIYLITIYGYFYGLTAFPWVLSFWILTQFSSRWTLSRVESVAGSQGGFIGQHGTLHEFLGKAYNSQMVRALAAGLSFICYVGLITCEVILGYEIMSAFLPESPQFLNTRFETLSLIATLSVFLIIVIYTAYSGFRAVIRTDKLQLFLLMTMLLAAVFFVLEHYADIADNYDAYYQTNFPLNLFDPVGDGIGSFMFFFVFMNVIFWAVWWPSAMDQWHRCASSRNVDVALNKKTGTTGWLSILYFAVLTGVFLAVGAMIRTVISPEGGEVTPILHWLSFLQQGDNNILSWVVLGLIASGLVAAVVSTIDSYMIVASQSFVSDIIISRKYGKTLFEANQNDDLNHRYLSLARKTILVLFLVITTLVFLLSFTNDIFTVIYTSFSFMMAVIPVLLVALLGKNKPENSLSVQASLIIGGLWALFANLYLINRISYYGGINDWDNLTFFYNLLYANPPFTAVVAWVTYCFVPSNK
jgi:Na+/proline symporter